ncbi:uncharacterized protein METZ01_LOCUS471231 [marine metagenome]|uniref:Uncharacterized protein n=1 Tax=marine metagenome TaxID=408172 RepID=A0A383BE46_9ZZZZ
MSFTATITEFGHQFDTAVVEITEANLEYRLNAMGPGAADDQTPTTRMRIGYSVYVDQAAKDAGGQAILNEWDESDAGADTDIVDGNIKAVAEAKIQALSKFSNINA